MGNGNHHEHNSRGVAHRGIDDRGLTPQPLDPDINRMVERGTQPYPDPELRATPGTNRGLSPQPLDPDIDRMVDRGFQPYPGPELRAAQGTSGIVDPQWVTSQQNVGRWISRRQRFLQNLTRYLQEAGRDAFTAPSLINSRLELEGLEAEFKELMRRSPTGLNEADRQRALQLLNRAYSATNWDDARPAFWRAVYNHPRGRRLINAARQSGMINLSDADIAGGKAPKILDFDEQGRRRYVGIDIDHAIPRERVPFYAYRADNLHLQTSQFNRQWLNRFSEYTPFPMGLYGQRDDIEEFVQANQLSRRQRPLSERLRRVRRVSRPADGIATLLAVIFAAHGGRAYAQAAEEIRARRRTRESRRLPPIRPGAINLGNIEHNILQVFDHPPLEFNPNRAEQFRRAVGYWIREDYARGGTNWWLWFETKFEQGIETDDTNILGDLFVYVIDSRRKIRSARRLVENLLRYEEEYAARAEAAERLSNIQADMLVDEARAYRVSVDDLMTIVDASRDIANRYRNYIRYLYVTLAALNEARRVNEERFQRLEGALARAYERRRQ